MSSSKTSLWVIITSNWLKTLESIADGCCVAKTNESPGLLPCFTYSINPAVAGVLMFPEGIKVCASSMNNHVAGTSNSKTWSKSFSLNFVEASFLVTIFLAAKSLLARIPTTNPVTLSSKKLVSIIVNWPSLENSESGVPFFEKIPQFFAASNLETKAHYLIIGNCLLTDYVNKNGGV